MKSKKRNAKKNRANHVSRGESPFSKKELEIIEEELKDEEAYKRNIPIFINFMNKSNPLESLRLNPFNLFESIRIHFKESMKTNLLTRESIENNQIMDQVLQDVSDKIDLNIILDELLNTIKETKIKREKRALLWAAGELISTCFAQKKAPRESIIVHTIFEESMVFIVQLITLTRSFLEGKKPFQSFTYNKFLDGSFHEDDWRELISYSLSFEPEFTYSMSQHMIHLSKKISRPYGVRFYRILNFIDSLKPNQKRRILQPGETELPQNDESQNNQFSNETMVGIMMDLLIQRFEFAKDALQSMKSAAMGAMEDNSLNEMLNAAAYSLVSPAMYSLFIFHLFDQSCTNALQINPDDEKELIIDITASPKNARLYKKYAQMLEQKGDSIGAYLVYNHLQKILETPDADVEKKILELREKHQFDEIDPESEMIKMVESSTQPQNPFANDPPSESEPVPTP